MQKQAAAMPIKTKVYLGLVFLCAMILLIYASTSIHIFYSHDQMSSLTDNYYEASNFISSYLEADAALESIVETPDLIDISSYKADCESAVATLHRKLNAIAENTSTNSTQRGILFRAMDATLGSYQKYVAEFFSLWEAGRHSEAYRLYYNTLRKCGGYLQQYCSTLLEEELYLGQDVSKAISKKNLQFTGIHIFICALTVIISIAIYQAIVRILKPVYAMIDVSNQITAGELDPPDINYGSTDEIGSLVYAFNQMKNSTHRLIVTLQEKKQAEALLAEAWARRAEQEKQLQEAVVRQLRSQITPHFLFNTLNIIGRTARMEEAPESERLIYALSHLFRSSLRSTVECEIPLSEEIEMAQHYITIQQARFGDRIKLDFRIGENVYPEDIPVPSFFLQPLIENSILHGLENRVEGGMVRVRIRCGGAKLFVNICDNGSGMSKERLQEVMRSDAIRERRFTGIGVQNVRTRILMAHPDNRFTFLSRQNLGTVVKIVLNFQEREGDDLF